MSTWPPQTHQDVQDKIDALELAFTPLFARKTTTESRNTTTTLANDTDLVLPVAANTSYELSMMLYFDGPAAGDFKFGFTVPASAVLAASYIAEGPGAGLTLDVQIAQMTRVIGAGTNSMGTDGSNVLTMQLKGLLRVAATAGNLQFLWAQQTSDAGNSRVLLDSFMTLRKVA